MKTINQQLTQDEAVKVFAMYWGQAILRYESDPELYQINRHNIDCKPMVLQLTKLDQITERHAVDLVKLRSDVYLEITIDDQWRNGKEYGFSFAFQYESSRRRRFQNVNWTSLTPMQFQYLVQKGYALPIFFSIGHWANGKNAIELGLAIETTRVPA